MNVRKAEDRLLLLALLLMAAGLMIEIGGWVLGLNTMSQIVSGAGKPPVAIETGYNVALICAFIGAPMLILGSLLLVTSLIVHFAKRRKPSVIS